MPVFLLFSDLRGTLAMAVSAFADIRTAVRRTLKDAAGTYWTDDDLEAWINEGQTQFCKRTRCLTAKSTIRAQANSAVYRFPDDFLDFIRMEDEESYEISPVSWRDIMDWYGEQWRDTTGEPDYCFADLENAGFFRFYPRPSASICDTYDTYSSDWRLHENITEPTYDVRVIRLGTRIYVFTRGDVSYFDTSTQQYSRSVITGIYDVWADADCFYVVKHDKYITKLTSDLVSSTVYTDGGTPTFDYITGGNGYLWVSDTTGAKTYRVNMSTWAATEVQLGGASRYGAFLNYNAEADCVAAYSITAAKIYYGSASLDNLTSGYETTSCIAIYVTADSEVIWAFAGTPGYVYKNGVALTSVTTLPATATMTVSEDQTALFIACRRTAHTLTDIHKVVIADGTTTQPASAASQDANIASYYGCTDYADKLYSVVLFAEAYTGGRGAMFSTSKYYFSEWDGETGDIAEGASTDTFSQEEGIVVDVSDDTDEVWFDTDAGEPGIVVQSFSGGTAFTLWYHRLPDADEVEISETLPLQYYVCWKAYLMDEDTAAPQKAEYYRALYEREVARMNWPKVTGNLSGGTGARPAGVFY